MKKFIWVTHNFEGFHKYKDAPDEVAYLRERHRHMFGLKIWIEIFHDDREIEFHMFKTFVKGLISENEFNNKSCEMISDDLFKLINDKYNQREIRIEVDEDGENGSLAEYKEN
jgi:hypothetical protein